MGFGSRCPTPDTGFVLLFMHERKNPVDTQKDFGEIPNIDLILLRDIPTVFNAEAPFR